MGGRSEVHLDRTDFDPMYEETTSLRMLKHLTCTGEEAGRRAMRPLGFSCTQKLFVFVSALFQFAFPTHCLEEKTEVQRRGTILIGQKTWMESLEVPMGRIECVYVGDIFA